MLAMVLVPGPACAARAGVAPAGLADGGTGEVREVVDGETVTLADGRSLRLVGIEVPAAAGAARGRRQAAAAGEAQAALGELVLGETVALRFAGNPVDRHGRVTAHLFVGKLWVQGELLSRGLARVRSFADNRAAVPEMLALERRARRARRGLWADPAYAVRRPEEAGRYAGSFQVVEGRLVDGASVQGQVYLNFAEDWRNTLSLRLAGDATRLFRGTGLDPLALAHDRVRVRGWISGGSRPVLEVTHPEQIERLRPRRSDRS
jgi:endonuclease YncB( thermonuclease family)